LHTQEKDIVCCEKITCGFHMVASKDNMCSQMFLEMYMMAFFYEAQSKEIDYGGLLLEDD
jgi:hypothetical protein